MTGKGVEQFMKVAYICSPLRGEVMLNIERAKYYSKYAAKHGVVPLAPHLLFTQFMDDSKEQERKLAMQFDMELLSKCDYLYVFDAYGISIGMQAEIEYAQKHQIPVVYKNYAPPI